MLDHYKTQIESSDALLKMNLQSRKYIVVSSHREENVDSTDNLNDLIVTLQELAARYDVPVIVSTHPRTQKRLDAMSIGPIDSRIKFLKPFGFFDYIKLQIESLCVVSDSGTITEEASLLNLPAITIRNTHKRPEGMDVGTLIMAGLKKDRVLEAVKVIIEQHDYSKRVMSPVGDYEAIYVSKKILRIVLSYTDYVNRTVWHKSL